MSDELCKAAQEFESHVKLAARDEIGQEAHLLRTTGAAYRP